MVTQTYPSCLGIVGCGWGATGDLTRSYSKGYLRSISGYLDEIRYHANGLAWLTTHAGNSNIVDTQEIDAQNGMARPKSIAFGPATSCTSPSLTQPGDVTVQSGATATLSTPVSGTQPVTLTWYRGAAGIRFYPVGETLAAVGSVPFTTPALSETTSYWAEAVSNCGIAATGTIVVTVGSCSPPSLSGPLPQTVTAGATTTLTVDAGPGTFTFQWYKGTIAVGQNSSTYTTEPLFADTTYVVRVTNACGAVAETAVTVTVSCAAPTLTGPQPITTAPGARTELQVSATGQAPFTYAWFSGATAVGADSATYLTPYLTETTTYRVKVTSACGALSEKAVTVTVAAPPSGMSAVSTSATRIDLSWTAAGSVSSYDIWRKSGSSAYTLVRTQNGTSWPDTTVDPNAPKAYAYYVQAVHLDGSTSISNVDIATTFAFSGVAQYQAIDDAQVTALRNAISALAGTAGTPFTATDSPLQSGVPIRAVHLTELRSAVNAARAALGVPAYAFEDPTIVAGQTLVRAIHWQQLQTACK